MDALLFMAVFFGVAWFAVPLRWVVGDD